MAFGLTPTGFVKKAFTDVYDDIKTRVRATPSMSRVNLDRDSFPGVVVAIASAAVAEGWDALQELWTSWDPDAASGRALENLCKITGTRRRGATPTLVLANVNVDPGFYPVGSLVASVAGHPDRRFFNTTAITNGGGSAATIIGQTFQCESNGPILCPSGSLTVVVSPYSGWNTITNPLDGAAGKDEESDSELRARRDEELASGGGSTAEAIIAGLEQICDVVKVFQNDTDFTVDGLPPHSFEVLVYDGTLTGTRVSDAVIAAAIWRLKPSGVRTVGTSSAWTPGSDGVDHQMFFSRPTVVPVYVSVVITQQSGVVADPLASCRESLLAFGASHYGVSDDVVYTSLFGPAYAPGVYDVRELYVGLTASPTGTTNISIDDHSIAAFDTSRITVTS